MGRELNLTEQKRLQSLINRTADASSRYYFAQKELNSFTEEIFGHCASDIDCDWIIDGVFGGCGASPGMTVKGYVHAMNKDGGTDITLKEQSNE